MVRLLLEERSSLNWRRLFMKAIMVPTGCECEMGDAISVHKRRTTVDSGDETENEGNDASEGKRHVGVWNGDDAANTAPDVEAVALVEPH